jgi:hypothetical protein
LLDSYVLACRTINGILVQVSKAFGIIVQCLIILGCLSDGTELDINLRSSKASIVACGGQAALTELCGQFA